MPQSPRHVRKADMATGILRAGVAPVRSLVEDVAYRISLRLRPQTKSAQEVGGFSIEAYADWRRDALLSSFQQNFLAAEVTGKRVLDFGCGFGHLSRLAASLGARHVIGLDLDPVSIEKASSDPNPNITFQLEPDPCRISLPDASIDVVLAFWMLEHVMEYESVVHEWARILAPGGKVLILWTPWRHPYGHHLHTIVPLPWIHMVLGPAALYRIAAQVYDSPSFRPRWWHLDASGVPKVNPYRGQTEFTDLNRLTTRRFETVVRQAGLFISRREAHSGSNRLRRLLTRIRGLQDFLCSYFVYELTTPILTPPGALASRHGRTSGAAPRTRRDRGLRPSGS
jgi:2-polyprenyl-3-methyl-5-hydroxy-6-metoxy-1,4-benzoquinol methylase